MNGIFRRVCVRAHGFECVWLVGLKVCLCMPPFSDAWSVCLFGAVFIIM